MDSGQCSASISGGGSARRRRVGSFLNGQVIRLDGALSTPLTAMSPSVK